MQPFEMLQRNVTREAWERANRTLVGKMLAEFMYEQMIVPKQTGPNQYEFLTNEGYRYAFSAEPRAFDSFDVDVATITCERNGEHLVISAPEFLVQLRQDIGMSVETTGHLVKEIQATLLADVHLLTNHSKTADEMIELSYEALEGEMSGHPWITYNKGRIGFGYDDYVRYAPEQKQAVHLLWIAVVKDRASFQSTASVSYEKLMEHELSEEERLHFRQQLKKRKLDPAHYVFMPVHSWQWENVIIQHFPKEIAQQEIVPVGVGSDSYLPQQSIRTFSNTSHRKKHHVKLPMSILNTLVYRGLPAERTVIAPRITTFIKEIADQDAFLQKTCRVILPGEIASINVAHSLYEKLPGAPYQYLEMLGVIWRESIYSYLEEGEQAITLAALHHVGSDGRPLIQRFMEKSGLTAEDWVKELFHVLMPPLLHYMYQYGVVFSPHGQNTILVLKNGAPHRLAVKDFVDDVNISDQPFPELADLAPELKAVLRSEPPEGLTQFIFTGLFICNFRYVSQLLHRKDVLDEMVFWQLLAAEISKYQQQFPELAERFELFSLFRPQFTKLCLNRNRMVDYGYEDGEDRPHASHYGKVTNVLAQFAPARIV
ncbi:IucA/IucC family siderophore biosynthesis protein [Fictibacillus macauensis ZFHKF-1]|uniref:IucA/IucC family siderophore biosynthesis protein n=1 Tax=Fictibacillus macauensis ZFHKF-1 TaxID=1196324 RepID=I8J3M5_9BACL|nr:IucA/IucC family siderophore biosynthesis protein [Fictibacillus macauensis]EIT86376.1 IucA/IucC family siderophore biosynthesis protein [Fictibacillus macauensis ZFHKF-1]